MKMKKVKNLTCGFAMILVYIMIMIVVYYILINVVNYMIWYDFYKR